MKPTLWLQETRLMRFEQAYEDWTQSRLTPEQAAELLGVCTRTFRRFIDRYHEEGLDGLIDKRISQVSLLRAPVDEVVRLVDNYQGWHHGWNVKHYYAWYRRSGGQHSYTWVKNTLQKAGAVKKAPNKGTHRKRRPASPWPGRMLHQDARPHEWVKGPHWDLVLTRDDATNEHYSMFFYDEEGTHSSFRGCGRLLRTGGYSARFIPTEAAIIGLPRKPAGKWTRPT